MRDPDVLWFAPNGWMPNNPDLPVLVYRSVLPSGGADAVEATIAASGWRPDWRDGVYPYHHYHSTAHEALACVDGSAELMLGGELGAVVRIGAGDVLVLPAGTGHRRVSAQSDLLVVGAYPDGQEWDVRRDAADDATLSRISAVPLPVADPVGGANGPLPRLWRSRR